MANPVIFPNLLLIIFVNVFIIIYFYLMISRLRFLKKWMKIMLQEDSRPIFIINIENEIQQLKGTMKISFFVMIIIYLVMIFDF